MLFDPWVMHHPDAGITDHLFNSPSNGGLGVDPETFFDRNFNSQTLDYYPHQETGSAGASTSRTTTARGEGLD
jgi:hypothetical protein